MGYFWDAGLIWTTHLEIARWIWYILSSYSNKKWPEYGIIFTDTVTVFKILFTPKQNKHFEGIFFNPASKKRMRPLEHVSPVYKHLPKHVNVKAFTKKLDQIIEKCHSNKLWYWHLQELELTLVQVIIFFNWDSLHASWTATTGHGVTRKRSTKILKHTGSLFRKNLVLIGVC